MQDRTTRTILIEMILDLIIVVILSAAMLPVTFFTSGPLRIVLGLVFLLFSPGYGLVAALFPRRESIDAMERIALSFGLSIAIVPLVGLILNYTPWGIRIEAILPSLVIFNFTASGFAFFRRRRLLPGARFQVNFKATGFNLWLAWKNQVRLDKVLTGILILAVMGTVGTVIYFAKTPKTQDMFTEFYILGPEGKAENYPKIFVVGRERAVRLVIVNHEQKAAGYAVEVSVDGVKLESAGPILLNNLEKWQKDIVIIPDKPGPNQKVEFVLYKGANSEPYQKLHLWIDVES